MSRKTIVPEDSKVSYERFHFAPAVESNGMVHCSGVIADDNGQPFASAEDEFNAAWASIDILLKEAGYELTDIIEYTSFHVGLGETIRDFMKVRDEILSEPWPAWTAIGVSELAVPGARVEIKVTASK